MNSVLLIGQNSFTAGVRSQVRSLDSLTVTTLSPKDDASALIETLSPDIVIVQGSTLIQRSVIKTLGQGHTAYFIVIESDPAAEDCQHAEAESSTAQCQVSQLHQLEASALALESGADAYLYLPAENVTASDRTVTALNASPQTTPERRTFSDGNLQIQTPIKPAKAAPAAVPPVFHPSQCRLIQAHIQIGLSRAQRYRDLSRINDWLSAVALFDALTQINNRRAFDLELPNQIDMARKKGTPLSLMMLDIDYFKSVNDRFGHLIGDEVLKQLAKRLLTNMRFYDIPFRYGGEEFVVTLNNTDAHEASAIANRLRESIALEPFPLPQLVNERSSLELTVSIGIAELSPDDDANGSEFLNRADQNLLKAKASGRNCVVGP